jgi:hypothetical protein
MTDQHDWLEHMIAELNCSELDCGAQGSLFVELERGGSLMLDDNDAALFLFATPEWDGQENVLAISIEHEGFHECWTLQIEWSHDWEVAVEQYREAVRQQLPAMRAAAARVQQQAEDHYAEQLRQAAERRKDAQRCPMCHAKVRACEAHEPGCVHCLRCWWCGHESEATGQRRAS